MLSAKEATEKVLELTEDLKVANETIKLNTESAKTELDVEKGKVETLTNEKAELQTFKDKVEEELEINEVIARIDGEFSKEVVATFSKEIEKLKENFGEFNTDELFINMYKESLKQTKEENEKLIENSKQDKDDIFEVGSDEAETDGEDNFDIFVK